MSNLQKRKLKNLVGPRQRARWVREFLDTNFTLTDDAKPTDQPNADVEVSNVTVSFDMVDAAEVNNFECNVQSEVD